MFRRQCSICSMVVILAIVASFFSSASAANTTRDLQSAVHRLTARLNGEPSAEGWRRYLLINVLETQAAKGEQADLPTLQLLLGRFSTGAEGLDHPVFWDVRVALQSQIDELNAAQVGDVFSAVADAKHQFRSISVETMKRQQASAIERLGDLGSWFGRQNPTDEQVAAFQSLDIDDAIGVISGMEFQLAPEISVGKMNSMIRDVQRQRGEIIKQIDALPFDNDDAAGDDPQTPAPDDQISLAELKKQQDVLDQKISELTEQRNQIRTADLPRARQRSAQFRNLLGIEKRFEQAAKQLADPYFESAQFQLKRFVRGYYYGTSDNLQETYLQQVNRLERELPKLADLGDRQSAGTVGNVLEWLENAQQVPHLIAAIRGRHSHPNFYATVSSELLNQLGGRFESQSRPVRENVDGRLIRGSATTHSQVNLELIDDPNQVHLSIQALADVDSNTYLQQGRIFAYIDSAGQAEARRSLYFNIGGLVDGSPYAAANISTCFRGTSSKLNLVNRIASKKFSEKKRASDVGASSRVRNELSQRFFDETSEAVVKGREALENAKTKLDANSARLPELYAHSQNNRIEIIGKKTSRSTLGAGGFPSDYGLASHLQVRLHDSVLSNYVDPIFSGKTFSDTELAAEMESLMGTKPDALTGDPDNGEPAADESFSITFAKIRPIQFEFEDNMLKVVVKGERFSQAEKQIRAGLTIRLNFRIVREKGKLYFDRVGKAELDYANPDAKDAKIVAFRSFLDGRLNAQQADGKETKVELPANLLPVDKMEELKDQPAVQDLILNQCRMEKGWFYLGWNRIPGAGQSGSGVYQSFPMDLPAIWTETVIDQTDSSHTPQP